MTLDDLIAVSGLPGIYKMVANRPNGLVVEEVDTAKRRFCSVRRHQFTPLGSVAIYTYDDTVPLRDVFKSMQDAKDETPLPDLKGSNESIFEYFSDILPAFDRERVYISDIKKVIRWFMFLEDHNLLVEALAPASDEEE